MCVGRDTEKQGRERQTTTKKFAHAPQLDDRLRELRSDTAARKEFEARLEEVPRQSHLRRARSACVRPEGWYGGGARWLRCAGDWSAKVSLRALRRWFRRSAEMCCGITYKLCRHCRRRRGGNGSLSTRRSISMSVPPRPPPPKYAVCMPRVASRHSTRQLV